MPTKDRPTGSSGPRSFRKLWLGLLCLLGACAAPPSEKELKPRDPGPWTEGEALAQLGRKAVVSWTSRSKRYLAYQYVARQWAERRPDGGQGELMVEHGLSVVDLVRREAVVDLSRGWNFVAWGHEAPPGAWTGERFVVRTGTGLNLTLDPASREVQLAPER